MAESNHCIAVILRAYFRIDYVNISALLKCSGSISAQIPIDMTLYVGHFIKITKLQF